MRKFEDILANNVGKTYIVRDNNAKLEDIAKGDYNLLSSIDATHNALEKSKYILSVQQYPLFTHNTYTLVRVNEYSADNICKKCDVITVTENENSDVTVSNCKSYHNGYLLPDANIVYPIDESLFLRIYDKLTNCRLNVDKIPNKISLNLPTEKFYDPRKFVITNYTKNLTVKEYIDKVKKINYQHGNRVENRLNKFFFKYKSEYLVFKISDYTVFAKLIDIVYNINESYELEVFIKSLKGYVVEALSDTIKIFGNQKQLTTYSSKRFGLPIGIANEEDVISARNGVQEILSDIKKEICHQQ